MAKEAVFTMKLESVLRDEFMAEASSEDRPASQVMRELMRDYIEKKRRSREYDDYLGRKVKAARADEAAGRGYSNEEIEAEFSAARDKLSRHINA